MYRACSTWQYEVVGHLVEHHLGGRRIGYVTGESYANLTRRGQERGTGGDRPYWRVLKSHEGHRSFARALLSGDCLAVYAFRDLREAIFSLMFKRGATFVELLRRGTIHQILANDRFWRAQPRVLVQRYEELIADPVTAVVQLARHIGLGVTRREATEIADEFSLESNQRRIDELRRRMEQAGIDLSQSRHLQVWDPVTLLHWNHLRPDGAGSWRTEASPRERSLLERMCGTWLRSNGYALATEENSQPRVSTSWSDRLLGIRDEGNLALGRTHFFLRSAAEGFPLAARVLKQLLRLADCEPGTVAALPPVQASQSLALRRDTSTALVPIRLGMVAD
jgi:hypothetical protein